MSHKENESQGRHGNHAALRGSLATIPCVPEDEQQRDELLKMPLGFKWTSADGSALTDVRFTQPVSGKLEINDVHVSDSGFYTCQLHVTTGEDEENENTKNFHHKLLVYDLAGHKFLSMVNFNIHNQKNEEIILMLKNILDVDMCGNEQCEPGQIKSGKCSAVTKNERNCLFILEYGGVSKFTSNRCDENCVKNGIIAHLTKAEEQLRKKLSLLASDSNSRSRPDISTLHTRHIIICNEGFHLVKKHTKRCFPCSPGSYSGPNSTKCHPCPIGQYQSEYGRRNCSYCSEGETTKNKGTKTKVDCYSEGGLMNNIASFFNMLA